MRVLAVCHEEEGDLGTLLLVLKTRGTDLEILLGYDDRVGDIDPVDHDIAIIMGGPMGPYEIDTYPYLQNEIDYLEKRIEADKPTLGVCLGAQLMAAALGQKTFKGGQGAEIGWEEIKIKVQGLKSPVHHFDPTHTKIMQSHQDSFDLPPQATLLAFSEKYENQAFQVGTKCLALQFHPEVTPEIIARWIAEDQTGFYSQDGYTPERLVEETTLYAEQLAKQTRLFFNEWLDRVCNA